MERKVISYKVTALGIFFKFEDGEQILPYHSIIGIKRSNGDVMVSFSLMNNTSLTVRVNNKEEFLENLSNKIDSKLSGDEVIT